MTMILSSKFGKAKDLKINGKLKTWIQPPWLINRNNPLHPDYIPEIEFYNKSCRRWTALRPAVGGNYLQVDEFGVVYLPGLLSLETWIFEDEKLYHTGIYQNVSQGFQSEPVEVKTQFTVGAWQCETRIFPVPEENYIRKELELVKWPVQLLKPVMIFWVVRPFDNSGYTRLMQLFLKENVLFANGKPVISFKENPQVSYFSNSKLGDLPDFFQTRKGNTEVTSSDGSCTGLVGYCGLATDLRKIELQIMVANKNKFLMIKKPMIWKSSGDKLKIQETPFVKTNSQLDPLIKNSLVHLDTFCPNEPLKSLDITRILVLNRFSKFETSRFYLTECLKKVNWAGWLSSRYMGTDKIICGISDYIEYSRDYDFLQKNWLILQRIGYNLLQKREPLNKQPLGGEVLDQYCWRTVSIKNLIVLGESIHRIKNVQLFRLRHLKMLRHQCDLFSSIDLSRLTGEQLIHFLVWQYHLRLGNEKIISAQACLEELMDKYVYQGGFYSALEFRGINLKLTATLGYILILAGQNFHPVLQCLLKAAGSSWNWPDFINPNTYNGIGIEGHSPEVLFKVLIFVRSLLVDEIGDDLVILPGFLNREFGENPNIEINNLNTGFGKLSLRCQTIGNLVQLEMNPFFHCNPKKIYFKIGTGYTPVFSNTGMVNHNGILESDSSIRLIRLKKVGAG